MVLILDIDIDKTSLTYLGYQTPKTFALVNINEYWFTGHKLRAVFE